MVTSLVTIASLALILFLGTFFLRRIRTPGQAHVPLSGGVLVLRMPKRNGILLGVCALFPAALLAAIASRAVGSRSGGLFGLSAAVLAAAAALAFAVHQFVAAFHSCFVVDEFGLSRVGVFTRRRIRWGEVARVAFNPVNRWFFFTTASGAHLWIPIDANGIADFATVALARLPPSTLSADAHAHEALRDLARIEGTTGG